MKLDKRRKYYLVLDCETATLPYANELPAQHKQTIAIAKPLIYDFAYTIVDKKGNIYDKKSFLISEIFSVPSVFNTAYYAQKRPQYLEKLINKEIVLTDWNTATAIFEKDLAQVIAVGAYNSMFDFKKAIPFSEMYIKNLYSPNFQQWYNQQKEYCNRIIEGGGKSGKSFDGDTFTFRGKDYPLFDVWGLCCEHLLNNDNFKKMARAYNWKTASGKYFSTTAETAFRYLFGNTDFVESHTALEDAIIESQIFGLVGKKNKIDMGITYFPFRALGRFSSDWFSSD